MAYLQKVTSVVNLDAFMNGIINFAIANGGFINHSTTPDGIRVLKKGDIYYSFRTLSYLQTLTLYCIEARMTLQPPTNAATFLSVAGQKTPSRLTTWTSSGPYISYTAYQTEGAIHGVLEVYPNVFVHLSFGLINKAGVWTGGEYISITNVTYRSGTTKLYSFLSANNSLPFDGGQTNFRPEYANFPSTHPSYIYHPIGSTLVENDFAQLSSNIVENQRAKMVVGIGMIDDLITKYGINDFNLRAPILPIYVRLYDPVSTSEYFAGIVPGVGYLNGEYIEPGSIVDANWQTYPVISRTASPDPLLYEGSPGRSLAYLRV